MTERRQQFARVVAALIAVGVTGKTGTAWGQVALRDQSGPLTAYRDDERTKTWLQQRFSGTVVDLSTYSGTASFYTSGYRDPYVSQAVFLRPSFVLGTRYKLALTGRMFIEEEYTSPDTANGRRFYPSDFSLGLLAKNLYSRNKFTVSGSVSATLPVSWESRYAHLASAFGIGGGVTRPWEFGTPNAQGKRWEFAVSLTGTISKSIRTSPIRGKSPGDTSGCREVGVLGVSTAASGPSSDTDHCGGPLSTSFGIISGANMGLAHGRYSATIGLSVINSFKYSVSTQTWEQYLNADPLHTVPTGRSDSTWGTVSLGYEYSEHLSFGLGVSSRQPALDSRLQHLRFPFFDTSGANANNYTQAFFSVTGTL